MNKNNISSIDVLDKIAKANSTDHLQFKAELSENKIQEITYSTPARRKKNSLKKGCFALASALICFSIVFLFVYFILPTFNIDKKTIYSVKCDAKEFKTAIPDAIIPPLNNTQTDYLIYYRSDTKQSLYAKISYKSETEEYDEYILFSNYRDFKNKSIFNDLTEYCVINGFEIKYKQTKKEAFASFSKGLHEYYFRYKTMQEQATGDGMSPDGAAQPKSAWESLRDKLDNVLV